MMFAPSTAISSIRAKNIFELQKSQRITPKYPFVGLLHKLQRSAHAHLVLVRNFYVTSKADYAEWSCISQLDNFCDHRYFKC
jgi:hypothetical protein